jgi:hypothetical protein
MEPNLAESIYIWSSINFLHFVPFRQQIWSPRAILVSDWIMFKKSSPLKLLGQMEPNLAGSIYVRSSINFFIWFHSASKHGHCYRKKIIDEGDIAPGLGGATKTNKKKNYR